MSIKGVIKSMTLDRVEWRKRIYMADPVKNPQPTLTFWD